MDEYPELNKNLITRLIKYKRVLRKLKNLGIVNVFSNNLSDAIGVSAAIVRKDFSLLNLPGNKRGGYPIDSLYNDLNTVLNGADRKDVILVGCGRIGTALLNYTEFNKDNMHIVAGFDSNPAIKGPPGVTIYPMDQMADFIAKHNIQVGILAVPEQSATTVFDQMITAGIKGILNFTTVELKCHGHCDRENCPRRCTISNVNISLELENLFYFAANVPRSPMPGIRLAPQEANNELE